MEGRGPLGGRAGIPWADQPGRMGSEGAEVSALTLSSMRLRAGFTMQPAQTCCPAITNLTSFLIIYTQVVVG